MNWFKFYGQDWLTDIKIMKMIIEDRLCYITLLCLASASEQQGVVKQCDEEAIIRLTQLYENPYETDNEVARARGFLKRLNDNGMITIDNNSNVTITNFIKRQGTNLSGYERVKRHREKQKTLENKDNIDDNNDNVSDNTNDNVRIDKNRLDKNRLEERKKTDFVPPSLLEVKEYCLERKNKVDPNNFVDFYSSKGWLVGRTKMKDWRACVRTWENRDRQEDKPLRVLKLN